MNMPLSYINSLYKIAADREKAERKKKAEDEAKGNTPGLSQREAEEFEDQLEGLA